jgi:uncharacterized repeat protein (TIGR01451 family)
VSERRLRYHHAIWSARPRARRAVAIGAVLATILTLVACIPPPPPGATFADTFTRASGPMGTSETGQAWQPLAGTWEVVSNRAAATSAGDSLTVAEAGGSRGRLQLTVTSLSAAFWMAFWVDGAADHWRFGRSIDGAYGLEQVTGGVATPSPAEATVTPAAGDRLACDYDPDSVTCTVNGTVVAATATTGSTATLIGLATADQEAVPTAAFDDISFIPSFGSPNLLVAVASHPSAEVGQELTYTISISNDGDAPAEPVRLATVLPGQVTFLSATSSQGECTATSGVVICELGTLDPGAAATAATTVRATGSGTATFMADVHIGDGTGPAGASASFSTSIVQVGPRIDVWYGPVQPSGTPGTPQRWVDVLGNVAGDHPVVSAGFTLNGGPLRPLTLGPTGRRLSDPGDFVVQIPVPDLLVGDNAVMIQATDSLGRTNSTAVTVQHRTDSIWPLPTSVDWSVASNPMNLARVVDGAWRIEGGQLRTDRPGYDRIVAVGDVQWRDFEVTVPVTIHGVDLAAPAPSGFPLIGFFLRWNGNNGTVTPGSQPLQGWLPDGIGPTPFGSAAIIRWKSATATPMQLWNHRAKAAKETARVLELGTTYVFKADVTTVNATTTRYRFKLWRSGDAEPTAWTQVYNAGVADLQPASGSLALVAHEADVSFGTVSIRPPLP